MCWDVTDESTAGILQRVIFFLGNLVRSRLDGFREGWVECAVQVALFFVKRSLFRAVCGETLACDLLVLRVLRVHEFSGVQVLWDSSKRRAVVADRRGGRSRQLEAAKVANLGFRRGVRLERSFDFAVGHAVLSHRTHNALHRASVAVLLRAGNVTQRDDVLCKCGRAEDCDEECEGNSELCHSRAVEKGRAEGG